MIVGSVIAVGWDTGGTVFTDGVGRVWQRPAGQDLSAITYPALFEIIGTRYADGTQPLNHFRVPDLQGAFLRCVDTGGVIDKDAPARTIDGPGNPSSDVGTKQNKATIPHTHYPHPTTFLLGRGDWQPDPSRPYQDTTYPSSDPSFPGSPKVTSDTTMLWGTLSPWDGQPANYPMTWVQSSPDPTSTFAPPNLVVDYILRIA